MSRLRLTVNSTIPITRIKLFIARILYRIVHYWSNSDSKIVVRNGIKYALDISEGIDLSLYLFGSFQAYVTSPKYYSLSPDAIVLDVGANIGVTALNYAKVVSQGKVFAFEPTHYAYAKFKQNIALNPGLSERIVVKQAFVSHAPAARNELSAYSSWKVDRKHYEGRHPVHGGIIQNTESVPAISIDEFCAGNDISRVDLIKIDTDGHEFDILIGATNTIRQFRPVIIFEAGLYIMREQHVDFQDYLTYFDSLDYCLSDNKNNREITSVNYGMRIPARGTIDILAKPRRSV
jgi:FkbM family methyltransferase